MSTKLNIKQIECCHREQYLKKRIVSRMAHRLLGYPHFLQHHAILDQEE